MTDFDLFWTVYPRRVGKLAAMRAYQKARVMATADEILAGVEVYKRHLPDEDRFIAHASTWLNQGRWMDEYHEPAAAPSVDDSWFAECQQLHSGACGGSLKHRTRMLIERQKAQGA